MPTFNLAYIAELIAKYARKGAYLLLIASFWVAISGMWLSFVTAFLYFYDVIQELLNMASGSGVGASDDLVQKLFGILDCIGFMDAFNNTKPVFISAITFLLARILFGVTLKAYKFFMDSVKPLVN